MTNRVVRSLICALIGALSLACTVESEPQPQPGPGQGAAPSSFGGGPGPVAGNTSSGGATAAAGAGSGGAPQGGTGVLPVGGNGGTAPVAGSVGMSGGGGADGTAGTGGDGTAGAGGGAPASGRSAGCGKPTAEEPRKYVQHNLTVNVAAPYQPKFVDRKYYTYLPNNYDANKAYPLVFYGAGCGATMSEPQPAMGAFNDEAILVFLLQVDSCFQAGSQGTADSPDIPYFDQALTEIENNYCIDTKNVFMSGYSSGAWLSITLSCSHGDKLRGIAVAAGGQQPALPTCKGQTAALFYVSSNDGGNPVGGPTGSGMARDRLLAANGCSQTTEPWDARWPSCVKYTGCDANPVVWCDHMGGHSNGQGGGDNNMARDGWWKFFTELPPE